MTAGVFLKGACAAVIFLGAAAAGAAAGTEPSAGPGGFWEQDVWRDPGRPFLFYGADDDSQRRDERSGRPTAARTADRPLQTIETLEGLQAEVKARLSRAVMEPSAQNMASYLEANAFLMAKAGAFADGWRTTLLQNPAYDWTAQHPTVNFASTALSRQQERRVSERLAQLSDDWGFIFFGDDSELTRLMLPLVEDFGERYGFEVVEISTVDDNPLMPGARRDRGQAAAIAGGLAYFPALVLVHRGDRALSDARLAATGVVDIAEIGRRVVRLAEEHQSGAGALPASVPALGADGGFAGFAPFPGAASASAAGGRERR